MSVNPSHSLCTCVCRTSFILLFSSWSAGHALAEQGTTLDRPPATATPTSNWSPKIQWIAKERFRGAYSYSCELSYFPEAQRAGVNAIITRLEIPNTPKQAKELRSATNSDFWMLRDLDKVKATGRAAKEHQIHLFVMVNMGASPVTIDDGFRNNARRYNNGTDFSPIDDIYWTRVVENRLLWLADMLAGSDCQVDGFMIDPEMYAAGARHGPDIDYGDFAMREFTQATGIEFAFESLTIAERIRLINRKQLASQYRQFQFNRLQALAQQTREKLQAKVPDAIMGFFIWRNILWYQAVAAGFSTPRVPCLVGTESTYPGTFDELFLQEAQQKRKQAAVPILYIPGVAVLGGKSPEYLAAIAANSYHRAIHTDGYWIYSFALFGDKPAERKPYLDVFTTTNRELDRWARARATGASYQTTLSAGPVPIDVPAKLYEQIFDVRRWRPLTAEELPKNPPQSTALVLRGKHTFFIRAQRGDKLAMNVRTIQLGNYTSPTACQFFRPDMTSIQTPQIPPGENKRIEVVADVKGFWACVVGSLNNAYEVTPLSKTAAIWAPDDDALWACASPASSQPQRFFFAIPNDVEQFTIQYFSEPTEPATFRLFDPDGKLLHEHVRLTKLASHEVHVDPGIKARAWWVETDQAAEDHFFRVITDSGKCAVAARPEQLLLPD